MRRIDKLKNIKEANKRLLGESFLENFKNKLESIEEINFKNVD